MATISYPSTLPEFRQGKSRSQFQTYRTTQPFSGPLYTEEISDESPVLWEVAITCVGSIQARIFQQFVRQTNNGVAFNKRILTENGFVEHEVKWVDMPLSPTQIGTSIFEYKGTILARALINPDNDINNPQLIIDWLDGASTIDIAVNQSWPEF